MRGLSTFSAALLAIGIAGSAAGQTDAYKAQIDQAKQFRLKGDLGKSDRIVSGVLAKDPQDFRANYTKGLIELDRGATPSAVSVLNRALASLKGQPAPDPTIYNTLGYALMNQGRLDEAGKAFQQGYAVRGSLARDSQQKLLNNMSLLYRLKGDKASSGRYLVEAARAGSAQAQGNLMRAAK